MVRLCLDTAVQANDGGAEGATHNMLGDQDLGKANYCAAPASGESEESTRRRGGDRVGSDHQSIFRDIGFRTSGRHEPQ